MLAEVSCRSVRTALYSRVTLFCLFVVRFPLWPARRMHSGRNARAMHSDEMHIFDVAPATKKRGEETATDGMSKDSNGSEGKELTNLMQERNKSARQSNRIKKVLERRRSGGQMHCRGAAVCVRGRVCVRASASAARCKSRARPRKQRSRRRKTATKSAEDRSRQKRSEHETKMKYQKMSNPMRLATCVCVCSSRARIFCQSKLLTAMHSRCRSRI